MPSNNKTPNLELNKWIGNEFPKRQDFVEDNEKIDKAFKDMEDNLANAAPVKKVNGKIGDVILKAEDIEVEGGKSVAVELAQKATQTAVQTAQNKADSAYNLANSKQNQLTISSSTSSTSTSTVANSYAVKQANDRANSAYTKANQAFQLGDSTRKEVVSLLSSKGVGGLTTSSDWSNVKSAMSNMSLGKKWASGTITSVENTKMHLGNLGFIPSMIFIQMGKITYSCNQYACLPKANTQFIYYINGKWSTYEGQEFEVRKAYSGGGYYDPISCITGENPMIEFNRYVYNPTYWVAIE